MISSIRIEGFRGFGVLELENLGQINLIMGANNCGKTAALEAINLLTSQASTEALLQTLWRRDGTGILFRRVNQANCNGGIWPLFFGNNRQADTTFVLSSRGLSSEARLTGEIRDRLQDECEDTRGTHFDDSGLALFLDGDPEPVVAVIPIDNSGNATRGALDWTTRRQLNDLKHEPKNISLASASLGTCELVSMWNDIVLTPDEERVLRIVASLDDGIDRIEARFPDESQQDVDPRQLGFVVKYKGVPNLLPIESLGSGMWRLFSLAVASMNCRNGTLLVDEIDAGLDTTTQSIMWRVLLSAANDLNAQVFATTHNIDCINILAEEACNASIDSDIAPNVMFYRIESGREKAIPLTPNQIKIAERHGLEIR